MDGTEDICGRGAKVPHGGGLSECPEGSAGDRESSGTDEEDEPGRPEETARSDPQRQV